MKVCGYNKDFRLGEASNAQSAYRFACITPPLNSHINISFLLSFSAFGDHSFWITKDGRGYAVGSNENGQITGTFDAKIYDKDFLIDIKDSNNQNYQFISAVCGTSYTLYLISRDTERTYQLAYSHTISNSKNPLFLNINSHTPKYLFGGSETSASIDTEGQIYIITKAVFTSPNTPIQSFTLPGGEKAVSIACCDTFVIVLSNRGRLFESSTKTINFSVIKEIEGEMIVEISGTGNHCLAVCKDGKVYGRGSNKRGQLGFEKERSNISEFTLISSLSKHKIISASAGLNHSLFITSEGKVLACGSNGNGQLLTSSEPSRADVFSPVETVVSSGASFCIAGTGISCVFVGCKPPINTPNRVINEEERMIRLESENLLLMKELLNQKEEINRLKCQIPKEEDEKIPRSIEILDADTIQNLRKIRDIGFGSSGHVIEVGKEEKYALKVMNTSKSSVEKLRQFIGEYEKMNMLCHPNIVNVFGIFLSDENNPPSILLEFCPKDLQSAVMSSSLTNVEVAKMIYQIAEAMDYIHKKKLIHRDLKPSNILIGSDGLIKISDFGIAKLMTAEGQSMTSIVGTQKFMAPEILREVKYNEKVDVYSFGVLLFYILSAGNLPKISLVDVGNGKKAKIPNEFTEFAKSLIDSCWNFDAKDRPSFEEIVKLIIKNDFSVVELSKSEVNDVRCFVESYKIKLPKY